MFVPGDVARFAEAFTDAGAAGAVAVRREPPPSEHGAPVEVEDGRVRRIVASAAETPFAHASLWALSPSLAPYLEGLNGPPYELAEAFQERDKAPQILIGAVEHRRVRFHMADE